MTYRTKQGKSADRGMRRDRNHGGGNDRLAATLYPINGLAGFEAAFRVLRVREMIPADNLRSQRLQKWADRLWREQLKTAVVPTMRFGWPAFLVPEDLSPAVGSVLEIRDVPDTIYHVEATDGRHVIRVADARGPEAELVCRVIERAFTDRLKSSAMRDRFWRGEFWTLFFHRHPANATVAEDLVNAYRGLRFSVVLLEGVPHLAADARTKYIGRNSLAALRDDRSGRVILHSHLDADLALEERAYFLRDNGSVKIPCRWTGDAGATARDYLVADLGQTVLQYYAGRYPNLSLPAADPIVFVQDRRGGRSLPVPASRLFPIFTTEYEGIKQCSVRPQLAPDERVSVIDGFLEALQDIPVAGRVVSPGRSYRTGGRTVFAPPRLEFAEGKVVSPFRNGEAPRPTSPQFDRAVLRYGELKVRAVDEGRPYHNEALPDAVLLYPESLTREHREQFARMLANEIERLTGQQLRIVRQEAYPIGPAQREGSSLLQRARNAVDATGARLVIPVLWQGFSLSVHGAFKEMLRGTLSQCVTERKAREIATGSEPSRIAGLLRNLALAVVTEAGVKPWVLADELHHDIHIGIDLLHGQIGYQALYGRGGRYFTSEFGVALHRGRSHEKIKKPEMRLRIEKALRVAAGSGARRQSLIVQRDGRWWPSESAGLREAITALQAEGVLPHDFRCAVVEVRKNHMPVRLFTESAGGRRAGLRNALPGSYLLLDDRRALLTTTGRPGAGWEGKRGRTSGVLLLEIVETIGGPISIHEVAEDTYHLTHLNWSAPDIEIALPVTIRWNDTALRETLRRESRTAERPDAIARAEGAA